MVYVYLIWKLTDFIEIFIEARQKDSGYIEHVV